MSITTFFEDSISRDPTWVEAYDLVRTTLEVPNHVLNLFKVAWGGQVETKDFMKVLGFSRLNPACLAWAAEIPSNGKPLGAEDLNKAIEFLGMRFASVVLAVNLSTRRMISSKSPPEWKRLLWELITCTEIGYRLGSRSHEIGSEAGALLGFAHTAGSGVLMASKPSAFLKFRRYANLEGAAKHKAELEVFGCCAYQVAALLIQQLGFGTELALGAGLGIGDLSSARISLEPEVTRWKSAALWIRALREGRNFPSDPTARTYFPELCPPKQGDRNLALEVLYTEVAKLRNEGSKWVWHLPLPGYDETQQALSLPT